MKQSVTAAAQTSLTSLRDDGLEKHERPIQSPQRSMVQLASGREVLNLCANNYLGLADHPNVLAAAHDALDRWGFGMASVRFICGTQTLHEQLEAELSTFLGTESTILYSSCFDANGGLYETLLTDEDAVISDALNHASIIDGVRLCKAKRFRYAHSDMADLEAKLQQAHSGGARQKLITTDGVFSMDGDIARLDEICNLADHYNAMVHFDDCHATGFLGDTGRGTHEYCSVIDRIDLTTGTFGKALGGASGGYTSGHKPLIDLLRQRSRPYLFSNALAPPITAGSLAALRLVDQQPQLRTQLWENTRQFREILEAIGLEVLPGATPILPVMLGDARVASQMAELLLERGVYVVAFSYPVVPRGAARIRVQVSAAHTAEDLLFAGEQFAAVKMELSL